MDPPTFITPSIDDNLVSASNPENQTIKRKRLTQACDACRKKKVKCSGDKPSCNNCTRLGTTCTYLPSTRKRGPRVGLVESLEKRLQQMEKLLQPLKEQGIVDNAEDKKPIKRQRLNSKNSETNNSDIPNNHYTSNTPNILNNSKEQQSQQSQQSFEQSEFIDVFSKTSNIEQKTQQEQVSNESNNITNEEEDLIFFGNSSTHPGFHPQREAFVHCDRDPPVKSESSETNEHSSPSESNSSVEDIPTISSTTSIISNKNNGLPPADIVQHLVACFFRHMDIQMPMFHEATFMKQLRQNKVSPFLIYAICAVSARYSKHPSVVQKFPYMAGQPFAAIALNKYLFETFDYPSVEHVQGLILITRHMYGIGKGPRAWMFTGMAVRMAQELGLHKVDEAGSKPSKSNPEWFFIQKEIRRRTFWSCFRLDRFAACALGRPTLIDENDCDVRLPCSESIWNLEHPFESPSIEDFFKEEYDVSLTLTNIGLGACLISATVLLGRVCQHVNRTKPSNALPPWNPNSQFAILEAELDAWYKSLTPHYTYTRERMQQLMASGVGTTFALIHLLYYAAVVVLNRPHIAPLQNDEVQDRHINFMCESVTRCCEAANKISSIAADINRSGGQYMCPFSIYPVFATTMIHLNDLYSPDINIAETAKKNLLINEQFMRLLEPYWAMTSKLLFLVKEMRKEVDENNQKEFDKRNGSEKEETIMDTETGSKPYWNRDNNNNNNSNNNNNPLIETNVDNFSFIIPEQLLSPRWFNDTTIMGDSWTSFLRSPFSPGPLSPSLLRLMKKENDNNSNEDYFSQDLTTYNSVQAPSAFIYDGYPMIEDWPTTAGRVFPLSRPIKHWTNISGNIMNSAVENVSIPTSASAFTSSLATTSASGDINIDLLI